MVRTQGNGEPQEITADERGIGAAGDDTRKKDPIMTMSYVLASSAASVAVRSKSKSAQVVQADMRTKLRRTNLCESVFLACLYLDI